MNKPLTDAELQTRIVETPALLAGRPYLPHDDEACEDFAIEARNEAVNALLEAVRIINRYSSVVQIDEDAVSDFVADHFVSEQVWRERMSGIG